MIEKTYEQGLSEGRLIALEHMVGEQKNRLDNHANRLRMLERIIWSIVGIALLFQFLPSIREFLATGG